MKTPQVKPFWNTGIAIGNGVIAKPTLEDNIERKISPRIQYERDIERKKLEALQAYIDSLTKNSK